MAHRAPADESGFERDARHGRQRRTIGQLRAGLSGRADAPAAKLPMVAARAFVLMAAFWAVALPVAAFLVSRPQSGSASHGFAFIVYGLASKVCHQLPARSFVLWGAPMPVCARCAGIYLAGAVTSVALGARRSRPILPSIARTMLLASLLPGVVTLVFEWMTGVAPANWIRAASGLPIGAAVSWLVLGALAVDRRSDEVN
jgi:uncharacterized membrane protein